MSNSVARQPTDTRTGEIDRLISTVERLQRDVSTLKAENADMRARLDVLEAEGDVTCFDPLDELSGPGDALSAALRVPTVPDAWAR